MALALEHLLHVPLSIGYVICSLIVIPLVTYGITLISQLQKFTQPVWIILQLLPFIALFSSQNDILAQWLDYPGTSGRGELAIMYWGAAASVLFALVAQIGEQVDYLRFMPEKLPRIGGSGGRICCWQGRGGCYWVPLKLWRALCWLIWPLGRV